MISAHKLSIRLAAALLFTACVAAAQENIPGVASQYREVTTSDGARLQAIVAAPADSRTPLHPLLFTQWVSCGTIEYREGSNAREILAALARDSGLALVRVERSAIANGQSCEALDFDTELKHYIDAFQSLLDSGLVDASRIYVYGSSLGSNTAPLVAQHFQRAGYDVAGIVVSGGGGVTYYERMLNFDRIYLERRPGEVAPADIHDEILNRARFHYEYLVRGRHPDDVARDDDAMRAARGDILGMSDTDHYGRPYAWHQQMARHNFLAAWAEVDAPVLVIFNEFDQFETRHGHRLIIDTVNRLRPGTGTFIERAGIGHSNDRYPTIEAAYTREGGEAAWQETANIMLAWLAGLRTGAGD